MRTITVILALLAAATPVGAQSVSAPARAEVSGGYVVSSDLGFGDAWPGWFVGAAWPATGWLAVSGELTSHRSHEEGDDWRSDASMWSAMLGARVSRRIGPSLTVFARGLSGMTTFTNHVYDVSPAFSGSFLPVFDVSVTITAPAAQLGAGADVKVSKSVSLRTLVEYRRIFDRHLETLDLPAQSDLEVMTGLVIRLGSR